MNANTGKIEINRDWYNDIVSKVEEFRTTGFMTGGYPAHATVQELEYVNDAIRRGKAVLV